MPENLWLRRFKTCLATAFGAWLVAAGADAQDGGLSSIERSIERLRVDSHGTAQIERAPSGLARFVTIPDGLPAVVAAAQATSPGAKATAFLRVYGPAFGLGASPQLRLLRTLPLDVARTEHVRFQQTSRGLPVAGAELTVHMRGDAVVGVNGRTLDDADLTTVPSEPALSADAALRAARTLMADTGGVALSSPRLEILNRGLFDGGSSPSRLAWFVTARAERIFELIWVDAASGAVLLHFNQQPDAQERRIHDAAHDDGIPGTLVRSEGQAAVGDAEVDAAYEFAGDTYDYFWSRFGRDSIDGAGQPLILTVRYGSDYQNAFWSFNPEQVGLGDGAARADDVVAHEITHGLTQHTADLYYYRQSGALNEAFSDIFGETVDLTNDAGNDSAAVRWLVAEDWTGVGPFRDMRDPKSMGLPGKLSDPELICGESDSGGVHTNSSLLNHAYALVVDGGSYNGRTCNGIGLEKAAAIAYRTLTTYLTTLSDFADADEALRQSCQDLIGVGDIEAADCGSLGSALDAVEMATTWPCPERTVVVTKVGSATGTVKSSPPGIDCGPKCDASFPAYPVDLRATPDPGVIFSGWSGECVGVGTCVLSILGPRVYPVQAGFDVPGTTYPVTVSTSGTGTVTSTMAGIDCGADCEEEYAAGSVFTLNASAPPGWALQAWSGDCSGRRACTLAVNGPKHVTATFSQSVFTETETLVGVIWTDADWGDYDGDGDLDLVVAGANRPSGGLPDTRVYRNDGGHLVDARIPLVQVRGFATWGDYDNDGDLDLVVGGYTSSGRTVQLYRNDSGTFTPVAAPFIGVGSPGAAWGDYDNDGDLDLVISGFDSGENRVARLYRNDRGAFVDSGILLSALDYPSFAWGDYDGDGDLDLVTAGYLMYQGPTAILYRNDDGTLQASSVRLPGVSVASVAWADYDGDGDLDLALAGNSETAAGPLTKVLRNDAGALTDSGLGLTGSWRGSASWGDYDADGKPDLLVHGWAGRNVLTTTTKLYRNESPSFLEAPFTGLPDFYSGMASWGDYDNDGRLDLVLAGANWTAGDTDYVGVYANLSPRANSPPQAPASPVALAMPDRVRLTWGAASDIETPGTALSYNLRVGTTPGGSEVMSAMADAATGYRRVVAPGNAGESTRFTLRDLPPGRYYWAVQAVDSAFAGSPFTDTTSFVVPAVAPEPVAWTSVVGVSVTGSTLTKTAASGWGNAGAVSTQMIGFPGGYAELTASETTSYRLLGLSNGNTNSSWEDVDFALYLYGGQLQVYEAGSLKGTFGGYTAGDRLRITASEDVVYYSRNGAVFYTSTRRPVYPLLVDCALYSQSATLTSVVVAIWTPPLPPETEAVVWTNLAGVAAIGNGLAKTASTAWGNAGATSTQTITSRDGYVEFTASEATTHRMLGLSSGNSNSSWEDVDFALYLYGGQVQVYEAGSLKGTFGSYATGDTLRVGVTGGVVSYSRNGIVFYTSSRTPVYPLLVDCALYSQGATLYAVVIARPPAPTWELAVSKRGTGTGRVTSVPGGIDCGDGCWARYVDGTVVTLTATADGGPPFAGWSGAGCTGTGPCVVTMNAEKSVTAVFGWPIPQSERDALVALYDSTDGPHWIQRDFWLGPPGSECAWYGVGCDAAGATVIQLTLFNNGLNGHLPAELGNLGNLRWLHLYSNQLSGTIPPELGILGSLQSVYLYANGLSGAIPPELGNCSNLRDLFLGSNELSGTIPGALGKLGNLQSLSLSSNRLSGAIPPELGDSASLSSLDLSSNRLSGPIPAELAKLTYLLGLDLSANQLRGPIPPALGNLTHLWHLNLSSNQLSGPVPPELGNLTDTSVLRIRYNALYSEDAGLAAFLEAEDPGWQLTQTVAPAALSVDTVTPTAVTLAWTPISYTGDAGGYRVSVATTADGPYLPAVTTADKATASATVGGLAPTTTYYFVVDTFTDPHTYNQNTVVSERTGEVAGATAAGSHLTLARAGTGTGRVVSTPAGIDCGAGCSAVFAQGTDVSLSATAAADSAFVGWSGEGCTGTGSCTVKMDAARLVTATFDLLPTVSIDDAAVLEGNGATVSAVLTVALSAASGGTVTVDYATVDGTAKAGSDYAAAAGTLSFPPGTTRLTIPVAVTGDTDVETDEAFVVSLSGASGATIADAQGQVTIRDDDTGPAQPVLWRSLVGVTASGGSLTKSAATAWGNAGAVSVQTIRWGGGYVEFTASETTTARMLGLSNGNTNSSWEDIDFALYLYGGQIQVYEAGSLKGSFGGYATGDTMRVAASGAVVSYSRNGAVFYASLRAPIYPLLVDCALYSKGATLTSVVIATSTLPPPSQSVVWSSLVGVTASANSLNKTAATAWGNAGAISTQAIASGDGYVEFKASETATYRMLGLSNGNTNSSWEDIDFSLYLYGSQIQVYEAGTLRGSFGAYASGDVLRVAVTGGVVTYSRNGTVFYTSSRTPVYPLLVDTALYSQNATLGSVMIAGAQ